jgi:hypothetical protein
MGIFDPQGLSSSPSTKSTVDSGISSWAQPYVSSYLNKGSELLNQGPNAAQQQVYSAAQNMQNPAQFGQGTNLLNQSGAGSLGTTGTALGYGQQASGAGQNYANMATDPSQMQAYMNPYIQQSLAPQLSLLNQQQALAGQGINAKAVGQGAFGGNRATLAQGLNAQNYDLARQQAIGQGYNEAFKNAQQAQQYGSTLGLQGLNTALQGVNQAQQGYQGATQAGVGLGNIGAQQNQADVARLGLQNTIANQQYNLPYQQANFMQGLMSGLPVNSSTTTGYQAGQNPYLQGIGAIGTIGSYAPSIIKGGKDIFDFFKGGGGGGITYGGDGYTTSAGNLITSDGYSDLFAEGGEVKRYAEGGIASINRDVINNPTDYSADTINNGAKNNLFGDVTKLLALDTIARQKGALQNQQAMQQPAKPPVYQQLQQQAMPQQMAQAMPQQGIDAAQSNLPRAYAGGGIIAFEKGGDIPRFGIGGINWFGKADEGTEKDERPSAFKEDIANLNKNTKEKLQIPDWLKNIGSYFTTPRQSPTDPDAQPGGLYGSGSNVAPEVQAKPKSDIVIHPNAPRGPSGPAAPASPTYKPADTSGIDSLTKGFADMIRGGEDFGQAESKAEKTAMRNLFLNMMNPERGASFVGGLGAAGKEAQAGLEKSLEGIQSRKDKQIAQLVGLGLKGEELKNAAKKMGIDETELQAKIPYYQSEVAKNLATAKYIASGKGGAAGSKIGAPTLYKIQQEYKGYAADPKSAPFFNQLDKGTQKALTLPGTESYNRAMVEFNRILQQEMLNEVGTLRALGAGSSSLD